MNLCRAAILWTLLCGSLWAQGAMTYTLVREANPTADQQDAYTRIQRAMDSALVHYNTHTTIRKHLTVYYNTGVPTAQANFDGVISFGQNRSYMVVITAMHEIGHTIGVGTTNEYRSLIVGGKFTGTSTTAKIKEISGNSVLQISGDSQHFWPYGLNYASEVSSVQDLINHCKIVNAMFTDMFHEQVYFSGVIRNNSTGQCMARSANTLTLSSCSDSSALMRIVAMGEANPNYRMEFGDRVLDIPNESTAAGVVLGLYTWNGKNHQRFTLSSQAIQGKTLQKLRMVNSNLYLRANGTQVQQVAESTTPDAQLWELLPQLQSPQDPVPLLDRIVKSSNPIGREGRRVDLLGRSRYSQHLATP